MTEPRMYFVLCMNNKRYRRRLNLHVIYRAQPCDKGWRLVDESGVEREYSEKYFIPIELPPEVAASFDDEVQP